MDDAGEDVRRRDRQHGRPGVQRDGLEQHPMQLRELDASVADDSFDDDVGAVAQHTRPQHVERRGRDRDERDENQLRAFGAEQPTEAPDRVAEVLRLLGRHTGGVPASGGTRLGSGEVDLLLFRPVVDDGHERSS